MLEISSEQNETFKDLLSLTESRGLKKSDRYLYSGQDLTQELLSQYPEAPLYEIISEKMVPHLNIKKVIKLSEKLFKQIDVLGTKSSILVLPQVEIESLTLDDLIKAKGPSVLLPLGDPGNLGAALRSCSAFGIKSVVLLKESAHLYLPKTLKAAAGAHLNLNFHYGPSIQDFSQVSQSFKSMRSQRPLLVLDQKGQPLNQFQWPKDFMLLIGEEGAGIPLSCPGTVLSIPMKNVESLNANVALSIALYEFSHSKLGKLKNNQ
jgi:TrmH family RNA methyltransferase